MDFSGFKRPGRLAAAATAILSCAISPAFAFGAIGFGGMHGGGRHGVMRAAPPPTISFPPPRPPFVTAPPPVRVRTGFVRVRDSDFFHLRSGLPRDRFRGDRFGRDRFSRGRFRDGDLWALGGPWGWGGYWGGYWDDAGAYGPGGAAPDYLERDAAQAEAPAPCPELLTWRPKLGRATRQRLCDDDTPDMRG